MLEYFSGGKSPAKVNFRGVSCCNSGCYPFYAVLILTTNNIESFDEAFLSRFAVCLKFDELSVESRRILWTRVSYFRWPRRSGRSAV